MGLTKIIEFATPASAKASLIDPPGSNFARDHEDGVKAEFCSSCIHHPPPIWLDIYF